MVIGVVRLEMHLFANITWSHDRWVKWIDGCDQLNLSHTLAKIGCQWPSRGEDKAFFTDHMIT